MRWQRCRNTPASSVAALSNQSTRADHPMAVFEMESWVVAEGKQKEHDEWMRRWLKWVRAHRELFKEWKSVRYFVKHVAGNESGRHFILWEYDSLAAYEAYKQRRGDY